MAASPDAEIDFLDNNAERNEQGQGDRDNNDDIDDTEEYEDASGHEEDMPMRGPYGRFLPRKKTILMKPETYDGTDDWQEYITHFEVCAELGRWENREKVLALAACLKGPARTFYISLPQLEKQVYRSLVEKLEQRFGSSRQQNRWLTKFESRKRQLGETIAALADDLRQMSQRAYAKLDARAQEALALNQLYKSISLEMKCRCIDKNCQTIADAVEIVERYEGILGEDENRKPSVRMVGEGQHSTHNRQPNNDATGMTIGLESTLKRLEVRMERLEDTLKRDSRARRPYNGNNTPGCYLCQSLDHFARNCPLRKSANRQNQGN